MSYSQTVLTVSDTFAVMTACPLLIQHQHILILPFFSGTNVINVNVNITFVDLLTHSHEPQLYFVLSNITPAKHYCTVVSKLSC